MGKGSTYRVLVINGGGARGIIPARILEKMTEELHIESPGSHITDLFDYVVGTSIGGIVASGLTVPSDPHAKVAVPKYDASYLVNLMKNEAQNIFHDDYTSTAIATAASTLVTTGLGSYFSLPLLASAALGPLCGAGYYNLPKSHGPGIISSSYSRSGLDSMLDRHFGNLTLNDTILPITLVSYCLDEDRASTWSSLKALSSEKDNYRLADAAGATSAAPGYFPPKITKHMGETRSDWDGGIFANSPAFVSIAELIKYKSINENITIHTNDLIILSLGTGNTEPTGVQSGSSWFHGVVPWAKHLILKMMKATESSDVIESIGIFKSFIRLNPTISEKFEPLDASSPEHMEGLVNLTDHYIEENIGLLKDIVTCLKEGQPISENCKRAVELSHSILPSSERVFRFDEMEDMEMLGDNI